MAGEFDAVGDLPDGDGRSAEAGFCRFDIGPDASMTGFSAVWDVGVPRQNPESRRVEALLFCAIHFPIY